MSRPVLPIYDPDKPRPQRKGRRTDREITLDYLRKMRDELITIRDAMVTELRGLDIELEHMSQFDELKAENEELKAELARARDLAHSRD
jgi:hypothetical protein